MKRVNRVITVREHELETTIRSLAILLAQSEQNAEDCRDLVCERAEEIEKLEEKVESLQIALAQLISKNERLEQDIHNLTNSPEPGELNNLGEPK